MKKVRPVTHSHIKKPPVPDVELRFSFKLFDHTDAALCPRTFSEGYTQALMQRLRDLSSWSVRRFTSQPDKSARNHEHDWTRTTRPDGFAFLNDHYRGYSGWQFCVSANEHGRVHGIIIGDTFHVIWLDKDHNLYP
jgi:hypothetical protein